MPIDLLGGGKRTRTDAIPALRMLGSFTGKFDTCFAIQQSHRVDDDYDGGLYGNKN
jgi:hypothetical protein